MNPEYACECIKNGVKEGLKKIKQCKIQSPKEFELEIRFTEHKDANRATYYPGVSRVDDYYIVVVEKEVG